MKKITSTITKIVLIMVFAALSGVIATAQVEPPLSGFAEDNRPFDFSDKYYEANGVQPYLIINRATGEDGRSVFTENRDENFRPVRFIETLPAYNYDGSVLFFNYYGELTENNFITKEALETARSFPMYVFPSTTKRGNRQANLINAGDGYFEKNPLGLSLIVDVEFTDLAHTAEGSNILAELARRNGYSLDGTPIIKSVRDIDYLTQRGLVTQKARVLDSKGVPMVAIAKVIDTTKAGAIASDAFLVYVKDQFGNPLEGETQFPEIFTCLQKMGNGCAGSGDTDVVFGK